MTTFSKSARQDDYGYYKVGNFRSYSKYHASVEHSKTGLPLEWIFNDHVYGSLDWTVEPKESLSELYRQRAQQLRDKYDYLVLRHSGGADSGNILDTFIDNDIKLDEICSYTNYAATGNRNNKLNAEIFHVAMPRVKEIQEKCPWIKYTVVDQCDMIMDHFDSKNTLFDWIYGANIFVNPGQATRPLHFKKSMPHWNEMFNQGKSVCFIYGSEKPRVRGINDKFYFHFIDLIEPAHGPEQQDQDEPWDNDELFYWSPDAPLIPIKQGHVIKNFFQQATVDTPWILTEMPRPYFNSSVSRNKNFYISSEGTHALIYPKWSYIPYQYKPTSAIFSFRDEWFFKLSDNDPVKYAWRTGLDHRWNTTPDSLKNDPRDLSKGFKLTQSRQYFLG